MDNLKAITRRVVAAYAVPVLNGESYFAQSEDGNLFTVIDIVQTKTQRYTNTSLVVRIVGDHVIVERDQNDKIVLDALLEAGIPRDRIILAYAGESVPEAA